MSRLHASADVMRARESSVYKLPSLMLYQARINAKAIDNAVVQRMQQKSRCPWLTTSAACNPPCSNTVSTSTAGCFHRRSSVSMLYRCQHQQCVCCYAVTVLQRRKLGVLNITAAAGMQPDAALLLYLIASADPQEPVSR